MADYDAQAGREPRAGAGPSQRQRESDEIDYHEGLRGVAGIVAGAGSVTELLNKVAQFAVRAIPGVEGAGVALIDREGLPSIQTWSATAPFVNEIDLVQYRDLHEGPCLTCMHSLRPTISGSLGSDQRWPHFGGRVARMGGHSPAARSSTRRSGSSAAGRESAVRRRSPGSPGSVSPRTSNCTSWPNAWWKRRSGAPRRGGSDLSARPSRSAPRSSPDAPGGHPSMRGRHR